MKNSIIKLSAIFFTVFSVSTFGNTGWVNVWDSLFNPSNLVNYTSLHTGDFDGDGDEEILAVQSASQGASIALFRYQNSNWTQWWSNNGNSISSPFNACRFRLVIGDFNRDGKDEVLCTDNSAIGRLYYFNTSALAWQYIPNSTTSSSMPSFLIAGNFYLQNDATTIKKKEVLNIKTVNSIPRIFMYQFNGNGWGTIGNSNMPSYLQPYQLVLRNAGDIDADGKDDLLGLSSWATIFSYNSGIWTWKWSTYGANNIGGIGYPFASSDAFLIGNIDYVDNRDEYFVIQRGAQAAWATTVDYRLPNGSTNPTFLWNWSSQNPPAQNYITIDWFLDNSPYANYDTYILVKAIAGQPKHLLGRRYTGSIYKMKMFKVSSTTNNY